jgi:uncharacterized damage-inducible protein DinB
MTTNQDQTHTLQQLLQAAHQTVMNSIECVQEAEIRQIPAPDEWTVAQLLAHIAKIEYFWMEKAVLITKEDDPNITRSDVESDRRTAAVVGHAGDSLDELVKSLAVANESAVKATGEISASDLAKQGHRGENNPMTVEGVITFLAQHMEIHARQITESRQQISQS